MAARRLSSAVVREVLDCLAAGMNPMQAARVTGVSKSWIYGLHHKMGGVYRPAGVTYSARYLDREERYELARLREAGLSVRAVAARLGRSPSTVSRELARNAAGQPLDAANVRRSFRAVLHRSGDRAGLDAAGTAAHLRQPHVRQRRRRRGDRPARRPRQQQGHRIGLPAPAPARHDHRSRKDGRAPKRRQLEQRSLAQAIA